MLRSPFNIAKHSDSRCDVEMETQTTSGNFSRTLIEIESIASTRDLTLRELLAIVGTSADDLFSLFLILPFLQPIPLIGLSVPIGFVIASFGVCQALDRPIWIPKRYESLKLPSHALIRILHLSAKIFRKLEKLGIHGRGRAYFEKPWLRRFSGALVAMHAVLLALPLPIPASNMVPAIVVFLFSLAALERDLLMFGLAIVATIVNAFFFGTIISVPMKAVSEGWFFF